MVRKESLPLKKGTLLLIFLLYFYGLVKVILLKFGNIDPPFLFSQLQRSMNDPYSVIDQLRYRGNLIPFHEIRNNLDKIMSHFHTSSLINFIGNIVAFVPFGFLLPLLFSHSHKNMSLLRVVLASLCVSLSFELTQLMLSIGTFDVDDLLLNTTGGVIGYAFYRLLRWAAPSLFASLYMEETIRVQPEGDRQNQAT